MQPKTFVIALKDHPISEQQLLDCKNSATNFGWDIETHWGVHGKTITEATWSSINVKPLVKNSSMRLPGQQGCFLSHWNLWNKCIDIDQPIVVLEHDAIIQDKWSDVTTSGVLVKLHANYKSHRVKTNNLTGIWTNSSHAYYIEPTSAKSIIKFAKSVGALPVDVMLGSYVVKVAHLGLPELVSRQNSYSTTHIL